jgi:two-component system sensor histidine kinase UhpB
MDRQTNLSVTRDLASDLPSLTAEQELVLYRVAQEALTNAIRHADAATASVALTAGDGAAILVVSDDGRGMWPAEAQPGNGIDGMRERAMLVTARLSITSRPAQGTTVRLVVPVGAELRDRVNGAS